MRISTARIKIAKVKKLIVFDFDGTLVPTKSPVDRAMDKLLTELLARYKVAIIGGGSYEVLQDLLVSRLTAPKQLLGNLFLFPTTATAFYHYDKKWKKVYQHNLSLQERKLIKSTFTKVFKEIGYKHPRKIYGPVIEDRGSQVTFSVFGQDIVKVLGKQGVKIKDAWKAKHSNVKMQIAELMAKYLPNLEVRAAGHTSIDVTKKGIDKAYGLLEIVKRLKVGVADMLFVGDAIFPGGNDFAVVRTGVDYIPVKDPKETRRVINALLSRK